MHKVGISVVALAFLLSIGCSSGGSVHSSASTADSRLQTQPTVLASLQTQTPFPICWLTGEGFQLQEAMISQPGVSLYARKSISDHWLIGSRYQYRDMWFNFYQLWSSYKGKLLVSGAQEVKLTNGTGQLSRGEQIGNMLEWREGSYVFSLQGPIGSLPNYASIAPDEMVKAANSLYCP